MPWRPIQTAAPGLLSLLQLKNLGKNPDVLLEEVRPTLEMVPWWLRGDSIPVYEAAISAATSELLSPAVLATAQNEWLYIHSLTGWWTAVTNPSPAGSGVELRITEVGSGNPIYRGPWVPGADINTIGSATATLRDFWVPPGYQVQLLMVGSIGDFYAIGGYVTRVQI